MNFCYYGDLFSFYFHHTMATMSDGNPVPGPCYDPCLVEYSGPIPCPVDVSIAFSTRGIVIAIDAYKATIDSYRKKLRDNGDKDEMAEKTLKASLGDLSEVCEDYIFVVGLLVYNAPNERLHMTLENRKMYLDALRELSKAMDYFNLNKEEIVSNAVASTAWKAMRAWFRVSAALASIENSLKALKM